MGWRSLLLQLIRQPVADSHTCFAIFSARRGQPSVTSQPLCEAPHMGDLSYISHVSHRVPFLPSALLRPRNALAYVGLARFPAALHLTRRSAH